MVDELITQFESALTEITDAIDRDNITEISELDAKLVSCWENILVYNPQNETERRQLASFLLDQVVDGRELSQNQHQARQKLLDILPE